jgi:hypothetical protein
MKRDFQSPAPRSESAVRVLPRSRCCRRRTRPCRLDPPIVVPDGGGVRSARRQHTRPPPSRLCPSPQAGTPPSPAHRLPRWSRTPSRRPEGGGGQQRVHLGIGSRESGHQVRPRRTPGARGRNHVDHLRRTGSANLPAHLSARRGTCHSCWTTQRPGRGGIRLQLGTRSMGSRGKVGSPANRSLERVS